LGFYYLAELITNSILKTFPFISLGWVVQKRYIFLKEHGTVCSNPMK